MEWIVKNAMSRDVERQHLNKILKEIRAAVDEATASASGDVRELVGQMVTGGREVGISVSYDPTKKVLDFAVSSFTLRLMGDVTGTATVDGLGTMTLNTTIDPSARGVEEAPDTGQAYWRRNLEWEIVPTALESFDFLEGDGILAIDVDGEMVTREIQGTTNEIDVANGDAVAGNPVVGLSNLTNTGGSDSSVR